MIKKRANGRRLQDRLSLKLLVLFIVFYAGSQMPDVNIIAKLMEISLDFAEYIKNIIDTIGGVSVLGLLFMIYKWHKERKK
jgi:hypothetical protein